MTNTIAIVIALILVTVFTLDYTLQDWEGTIFVGRKLTDLIEYLAFWR